MQNKERDKKGRRIRKGERKRTTKKEGEKRSARLAASLLSTSAPYPVTYMDKSSHFELKQGTLWKSVGIGVASYVLSPLRTNLQYILSPKGTQELILFCKPRFD